MLEDALVLQFGSVFLADAYVQYQEIVVFLADGGIRQHLDEGVHQRIGGVWQTRASASRVRSVYQRILEQLN